MALKKRTQNRKTKKSGKNSKPHRVLNVERITKKHELKKRPLETPSVPQRSTSSAVSGRERYVITVESIRGDTPIGDLLVTFPHTRDVLIRKGLRLEAEDAGDIYMTLDAFSAMNGLEVVSLVEEIVQVAREPPPQLSPPQIAVSPVP